MVWLGERSTRVRVQSVFLITYDMSILAEQSEKWEEWRLLDPSFVLAANCQNNYNIYESFQPRRQWFFQPDGESCKCTRS